MIIWMRKNRNSRQNLMQEIFNTLKGFERHGHRKWRIETILYGMDFLKPPPEI